MYVLVIKLTAHRWCGGWGGYW